ncbi:MAG TPA: hypothetical protein VFS02_16080 [Telluria sp.]|nr:hypothetical protein [Telluria sp.]
MASPTSIIALAGRALRGPVNQPTAINSFAEFERTFGGLWPDSELGYSVRDHYRNGGGQAIVVRLFHPGGAGPTHAALDANGLLLTARTPGAWGNALRARIDHNIVPADSTRFNLSVRDGGTGRLEIFRNLSCKGDDRRVDRVLACESTLVISALPALRPRAHAHIDPGAEPPRTSLWDDNTPPTCARVMVAANDGVALAVSDYTGPLEYDRQKGRYALSDADFFKLLCIPAKMAPEASGRT